MHRAWAKKCPTQVLRRSTAKEILDTLPARLRPELRYRNPRLFRRWSFLSTLAPLDGRRRRLFFHLAIKPRDQKCISEVSSPAHRFWRIGWFSLPRSLDSESESAVRSSNLALDCLLQNT